jgi:hypothetical protein
MVNCRTLLVLAVGLLLGPSCGGGGGAGFSVSVPVVPPVGDPIILNFPDTFTMIGTGSFIDGGRDYAWSCSKSQARLDLSSGTFLGSGSFRLEILDGAGALVHDNTYSTSLLDARVRAVTRPGGTPGLWDAPLHVLRLRPGRRSRLLRRQLHLRRRGLDRIRLQPAVGRAELSAELGGRIQDAEPGLDHGLGERADPALGRGERARLRPDVQRAVAHRDGHVPGYRPRAAGTWTLRISFTNVVDGLRIEAPF